MHVHSRGVASLPKDSVHVLQWWPRRRGVVVGRLSYREDGDLIDCQRMGVGGKAIPPNVDKVPLAESRLAP